VSATNGVSGTEVRLEAAEVVALNVQFLGADPSEVLDYVTARFGARMAVACSLGVEDVALLHMLAARNVVPAPRVFVLDTGRLPEETYDLLDRMRIRYAQPIDLYFPDTVRVESLVREKGALGFRRSVEDRRECCAVRKLGPLARALVGVDAWVTGLRRGQSSARAETNRFELDAANDGILKLNPLVDWSEERVWSYVRANDIPYNALHDVGYPSIGCAPCTRAVATGDDARSGRWWWEAPEEGRECGLHGPPRGPR
jgi:phosphoadenosine phosphosulfate reductase